MFLSHITGTIRPTSVIFYTCLSIALACGRLAQSSTPSVRIRLLDSETGFVIPAAKAEAEQASPKIVGEGARQLEFVLTHSTEVHINVPGYRPFAAVMEPSGSVKQFDVALQRLSLPTQFARIAERMLERPETSVMGFVSDESTGQPLGAVEVASEVSSESVKTDDSGFFYMRVKLKSSDPIFTTITFIKMGYNKLIRDNVELFPADTKKYRIRLRTGGQTEVVDE